MKIKLAILDNDQAYLSRISGALEERYSGKVEIYCFTDLEKSIKAVESMGINILLATTSYDFKDTNILPNGGFAYLTEMKGIENYKGERAVCKYQKIDLFYNTILDIYSETNTAKHITGDNITEESIPLYVFLSANGGVGTSTIAAACALNFVRKGISTFYLNLEEFGTSNIYFNASGPNDLRDVMIALKSSKANVMLKLNSSIKKDNSGVMFISSPKNAYDICSLTADDIENLITLCKKSNLYNRIIIDINFAASAKDFALLKHANKIVFVSDGSEVSNSKLLRAYKIIEMRERQDNISILNKFSIFYNRFSNKSGKHVDIQYLNIIGGAPKYENIPTQKIIQKLVGNDAFNDLV